MPWHLPAHLLSCRPDSFPFGPHKPLPVACAGCDLNHSCSRPGKHSSKRRDDQYRPPLVFFSPPISKCLQRCKRIAGVGSVRAGEKVHLRFESTLQQHTRRKSATQVNHQAQLAPVHLPLHTLMACMCWVLHCWHCRRSTIFLVVLACKLHCTDNVSVESEGQ